MRLSTSGMSRRSENSFSFTLLRSTSALTLGFICCLNSDFGLAFLDAKEETGARTRHSAFDTSVLEVNEADFEAFLAEVIRGRSERY